VTRYSAFGRPKTSYFSVDSSLRRCVLFLQHFLTITCNDNDNAYISHLLYYSITLREHRQPGSAPVAGHSGSNNP
jgi:hypothetical protein